MSKNDIILLSFEQVTWKGKFRTGNNIPQRFRYIDIIDKFFDDEGIIPEGYEDRAIYYPNRSLIKVLKKLFSYKCIVSERDYYSIFGFIYKVFFGKRWIVDFQDCPLKECTSLYKGQPVKWIFSFLKAKILYFLIRWSDAIVVSFSAERFKKYYSGSLKKVNFFYNSLPISPPLVEYKDPIKDKKISLIYIGADLHEYGIKDFITKLDDYALMREDYDFKLTIIGHENSISTKSKNLSLINFRLLSRDEVIQREMDSDIGVVPFKPGSDIYFTYPIKSIESYFYCRKTLLGDCKGMHEMYDDLKTKDIHFFDAIEYSDFGVKMDDIINQLMVGEFSSKEMGRERFNAEVKNMKIKEIYERVLNSK